MLYSDGFLGPEACAGQGVGLKPRQGFPGESEFRGYNARLGSLFCEIVVTAYFHRNWGLIFSAVGFIFQMNQKVQVSYHALLSSQDESNQVLSWLLGDTGRLEWWKESEIHIFV